MPVTIGFFITIAGTMLYLTDTPLIGKLMQRFDFVAYDIRYQLINPVQHLEKHNIVIVDVDEHSLNVEGRWPWSRGKIATLIQAIYQGGAAMVGMDVVFAEAERNPVSMILEAGGDELQPELQQQLQSIAGKFAYDEQLAAKLGSDSILGYFFYLQAGSESGSLPEPLIRLSEERVQQLVLIPMGSVSGNLPQLQANALSAGYLTIIPDDDGVVRRAPMVLRYGLDVYSSLALEVVRQFVFADKVELQTAMQYEAEVLESIQFDKFDVPTNAIGQALIPFMGGRGYFPYISATDLIRGKADATQLEGAIVLVGTSAWGLGDLKSVPLAPDYPGVEVHANLINGILNSKNGEIGFPYRPDLARNVTGLVLLLTGFVLSYLLSRLNPFALVITSVTAGSGIIAANFYVWQTYLLDFPLAPHVLMTVTLTVYFFADGFLRENLQRLEIKRMFGQYVPEAHVDKMIDTESQYSFEGESKEMTVLFSDIRNFTTISEGLGAAELKQMLNQFFTPITQIIFENQGTIDKYVGDMVMAFWGAPLEDKGHAEHAVGAALQMLKKVEELKPEFKALGLPEIGIGVGINTGLMNVGDMGSEFRKAYTVLGDAVNLGSRLEGVTKFYGVKLLVGETTQMQAPQFQYRMVDRIKVKGKTEPITVYEPVCLMDECSTEEAAAIARFHMALFYYYYQDWEKSTIVLKDLKSQKYLPLYDIYLERIEELKGTSLGERWDGVYTHTSK